MKIYHRIEDFQKVNNAVVTTGTFDGVHVGHQHILNRLKAIAQKINGETVLLTFYPHPRMVLFPGSNDLKLLSTEDEKRDLLSAAGIDHLIIHPFTKKFSRLSSVEFVRNILVNTIGTSRLVIGYNHHFGRNREGSFEHLKEFGPIYGFDVEEIPAQDVANVDVSSTKIRNALLLGDIETANNYLGYHYSFSGQVIKGRENGRKIGFPTANLSIENNFKLIPPNGVYAVFVELDGLKYSGMMNIGYNPTIGLIHRSIEVNIFDFDAVIYNKRMKVSFLQRIREEEKFNNLEDLRLQLLKDRSKVESIVNKEQCIIIANKGK